MRRALWAVLLLCIALPLTFAVYVSQAVLYPPWLEARTPEQGLRPGRYTDPGRDFGLAFEAIEIPGPGGSTLRGWFIPARGQPDRAVIGLHGGGSDRRSWLALAPALQAAGYPVLLYDARGHGTSEGEPHFPPWQELLGALDWLETQKGVDEVVLLGSSLGASTALVGAALDDRVRAVVAQSAGTSVQDLLRAQPALSRVPDWLVDLSARMVLLRSGAGAGTVWSLSPTTEDLIARIAPRPVLLIHGSEDELVPVEQARRLHAAAGPPKELWIVPGGGHRGLRRHAGDAYAERVLGFLTRYAPANPGGTS